MTEIEPAAGDPEFECAKIPANPVKDLMLGNVYKRSDPTRSEIDEEAKGVYQKQTKAINIFQDRISRSANAYLKSEGRDQKSAQCALEWLHEWAEAGALLGKMNAQGSYARQWTLAALSSSYLQIRDYAPYDDAKKKDIDHWLETVAYNIMADNADTSQSISRQNNLMYWGAWAVTITGVVTDNKDLYDWGVGKAKYALHTQIEDDGTLPLELTRGKKALQYHVFALAPLVMICEAALRNGENLYDVNDGAIHKLVDRTFTGLEDPSYFAQLTGVPQVRGDSLSRVHFSWLEAYNARFPDPAKEAFLRKNRPVFSARTGGDMTYLYSGGISS